MTRPLPFDDNVKALKQVTVLECIWTDIPEDVLNEVQTLWRDYEYRNDHYYFDWQEEIAEEHLNETYPIIAKYLSEHNVKNCLIHYWW